MKIQIAENIKRFRIARGITQNDLAVLLSVSPQAVSRWENGQAYPDIESLPEIAKYLEVSVDDLMGIGARSNKRLEKELHERLRAKTDDDSEMAENELRILEIYEELAADKKVYLMGYFRRLMQNKNGKGAGIQVSEERVAEARLMIRESMRRSNMKDRVDLLGVVALCEDEDKLELWADEYQIPDHYRANIWDELLLYRYSKVPEKLNVQNQKILYKNLTDALHFIDEGMPYGKRDVCNDPHRYRAALDMIAIYSKRIDDIFLIPRIIMEARYAESLLKSGLNEESLEMFAAVRDHLIVLRNLPDDRTLCGSVPMLDKVTREVSLSDKHVECVMRLGWYGESRYDVIREDRRFAEFLEAKKSFSSSEKCRSWALEHGDPITDPQWQELLARAKQAASAMGQGEGAVAMLTSSDEICVIKQSPDENLLKSLIQMKARYGSRVKKLVYTWNDGSIDLPSYDFREMLLSVDERNASTEMLLGGLLGFIVKPLNVTMSS
ncbi:MAG: helix-turn-helix transcriptional regulator [Clostridia bacterium]|nr:helix-turn-helix transcriptional regulator [Clostridia bacterium]